MVNWCIEILQYIMPPENVNTTIIRTQKKCERKARPQRGSKLGSRVHALTLQQKMPQGEAWQRFLSNDDNKNYLISIFLGFSRKFYIRRNNNKVGSTETGRIVITHASQK